MFKIKDQKALRKDKTDKQKPVFQLIVPESKGQSWAQEFNVMDFAWNFFSFESLKCPKSLIFAKTLKV